MTYQIQIPLTGIAGWRYLERTQDVQKAVFEDNAAMQREIDYFTQNIASVKSAADLVADKRLLQFALSAYGLEDDVNKKALVRKILEEGTEDKQALANRITISGYKEMAEDFGFGNATGTQTGTTGFAAKIVAAYKERAFEGAVSDQSEALGLAMLLTRKAEALSEGDGKSWYTVLGDKQLRKVFEGAFGLPSQFVNIDIDKQAETLQRKAEQMFGDGSLKALQDPANVDKLIMRFLARRQIDEGLSYNSSPASGALALLQASTSNGSQGLLNLLLGG